MSDKSLLPLLLLLLLGLVLSCSQETEEEGPQGAVKRFYRHLNSGDYQAAKEMYNAEARVTIDDPELFSEAGFRKWAEEQTNNGSIKGVEILQAVDDDTGADIEYEISYRDGTTKRSRVRLTQEEGEWKLGFAMDATP
jgi:hypothetical protein